MNLLHHFYIRDKQSRQVKFKPNKAQLHYIQHRTGRDYILKARQLGVTTLEQLRKLKRALLFDNVTVATIAHQQKKTEDIFRIAKYAWDNLPQEFKDVYNVKYDNVRELYFGANSSRYYVDLDTRSGTVNDLHISELASVKDIDELFASSLESVPKSGTVTFETTADGLNKAYDFWQDTVDGKNVYTPHFYNWTWDEEYRIEPPQDNAWRQHYQELARQYGLIADMQGRHQVSDAQFYWYYTKATILKERTKQEYPTIAEEAFLSSSIAVFDLYNVGQISPSHHIATEKGTLIFEQPKKDEDYIIGCDTSEGVGNDASTIEIVRVLEDRLINVASFRDNTIRPDQLADLLYKLGRKYNDAFLIPERNGSGLTTVLKLQEMNYPRVYIKKSFDKKTQKHLNEYGWRTTSSNRDLMIDDFVERFEEGLVEINSPYALQEMKTFVRKENGKREHDDGYHDDNLFALYLANQGVKFHRQGQVSIQNADVFGF